MEQDYIIKMQTADQLLSDTINILWRQVKGRDDYDSPTSQDIDMIKGEHEREADWMFRADIAEMKNILEKINILRVLIWRKFHKDIREIIFQPQTPRE